MAHGMEAHLLEAKLCLGPTKCALEIQLFKTASKLLGSPWKSRSPLKLITPIMGIASFLPVGGTPGSSQSTMVVCVRWVTNSSTIDLNKGDQPEEVKLTDETIASYGTGYQLEFDGGISANRSEGMKSK